jgi:glucose-6-phosphate isomerase
MTTSSPFVQCIDACLENRIGPDGLTVAAYQRMLEATRAGLKTLRDAHDSRRLPLLRLPARTDDVAAIRDTAQRLSAGATDVVFLGTGGSSLGGQTLAQIGGWNVPGVGPFRTGPRLHFMDNLDPASMQGLLDHLPLTTTRFIAISKSGGTGETLMQAIAVISALRAAGHGKTLPQRLLGISEPAAAGKGNGLRELLAANGVTLLDHDPQVGGRYSGLTNVGLLAAAVAGLDPLAIRAGAAEALAPVLAGAAPEAISAAVGAAVSIGLAQDRAKTSTVLMAYCDRLERFTAWYLQLWAESLGKEGKGTTPLRALGPVDQHSQLQLFLAGPRDKLFTVVTTNVKGTGPLMDAELAALARQPDFAGKRIGDLVAAQGRATADTFAKNGLPVRTIHVPTIDERAIGALMMHFFLETILAAHLLGVDPFDQPAVEEGKVLAKQYMAQG